MPHTRIAPETIATPLIETRNKRSSARVESIDILRACTMILMIFVNDLWSLQGIPDWLGHVEPGVDGIGLSDVVFPAFLFIVGLSLPFAMENRKSLGDSRRQLLLHVLSRTLALLVMGVFLVNGESINEDASGISRSAWNVSCCLSLIVLWNRYPESARSLLVGVMRVVAVIVLLVLAILYRGGEAGDLNYFGPKWWGILGLIGWAYLVSGWVVIYASNRLGIVLGAWLLFAVLSMVHHAGFVPSFLTFIPEPIRGGTLTGLTLGGVATSLVFQFYRRRGEDQTLAVVLVASAFILIGLSMITRPAWGLAKLGATPAWLFLCSAFTILAFLLIYWIADVKGKVQWFTWIKPAGTATLLCYLIPYFIYALMDFFNIDLPAFLLIGGVGLMKSFLFAIFCAVVTGWLLKAGVRLRL